MVNMSMLTAREYYYEKIAPEERYRNYQSVHQKKIYKLPQYRHLAKDVLGHLPTLSNDLLIETCMREIISTSNSSAIRNRIEHMFTAKRKKYLENAYAKCESREYNGDLVFYFVGLSDACFQYCTLFSEFINVRIKLSFDKAVT